MSSLVQSSSPFKGSMLLPSPLIISPYLSYFSESPFFNHKVLVLSSFSDFIQFFFFLSPLTKSWPHFFNSSCLLEPPPSLAFTHTDKCQLKNLFFFFTKSYCFVTLRHISLEEVARTCCLWIQMALQQPRAVFYKLLCQRGSSILSINRVILKWSGSRTLPRS